ncbi:TIGR02679 family protein [Rathayibacter soli]|uniref:TIGR02679 family protein n=1 Tax=Rathayibacter soli TaxID=3144168 RepID=UPI0027E55781|nr:TIGR02679 family protein [Glaciibacter superstes]
MSGAGEHAVVSEPGDIERLRRLLGTPDTAWLLERVRRRLASTGELRGTVTLQHASVDERRALARILNRQVRAGHSATVSLELLDAALRREAWPAGLASAVVALAGPVADAAARLAEREAWQRVNDRMRAIGDAHPAAAGWAAAAVRAGLLKRASGSTEEADRLVTQLAQLADALPAQSEVLGVLAARLFGDAHALDVKTALGPLAAGLAAAIGGVGVGSGAAAGSGSGAGAGAGADVGAGVGSGAGAGSGAGPGAGTATASAAVSAAHWRRQAWLSVGVVVDELSSFVLTLNLPGGAGSASARALAELSATGQPAILSYRQVALDGVGTAPPVVFVCENPAVVASAADRIGADCLPLVCVGGQPGAAAVRLLVDLAANGSQLRYHGDFDAGGMTIARVLASRVAWRPWRFTAGDYEDACVSLSGLAPFTGTPGDTPWDPRLAEAMGRHGLRVEEESVLDGLLLDLARVDASAAAITP